MPPSAVDSVKFGQIGRRDLLQRISSRHPSDSDDPHIDTSGLRKRLDAGASLLSRIGRGDKSVTQTSAKNSGIETFLQSHVHADAPTELSVPTIQSDSTSNFPAGETEINQLPISSEDPNASTLPDDMDNMDVSPTPLIANLPVILQQKDDLPCEVGMKEYRPKSSPEVSS